MTSCRDRRVSRENRRRVQLTLDLIHVSACLRYPARHGCFTEKRTLAEFPKNIRKILAVRFGRLGDVILLLPSLHQLKSCFPGASLTFVTDHRHASEEHTSELQSHSFI